MSEALDDDTALDNPDAAWVWEPYYFRDHAQEAIDVAQKRLEDQIGPDRMRAVRWGVTKKPKPPPIRY